MQNKELYKLVERTAGRRIQTPRDFDWLAEQIRLRTNEPISPTTLKRLWGYIDEPVKPRKITLDILSQYVGYVDYEAFCKQDGESQSNMVLSGRMSAEDLTEGQRVELRWQPDRICTVKYLGEGRFIVEKSVNSKLAEGDTFDCHLFIEHEPLYLDNLVHLGKNHSAYVAGKKDGVTWTLEP